MRPLRLYLLRFVIIERNAVFFFFRELKKKENEKCNLFIFIASRRKAEMVACVLTAAQHAWYAQTHSSRGNVSKHASLHVKVSVRLFINNSFAQNILH